MANNPDIFASTARGVADEVNPAQFASMLGPMPAGAMMLFQQLGAAAQQLPTRQKLAQMGQYLGDPEVLMALAQNPQSAPVVIEKQATKNAFGLTPEQQAALDQWQPPAESRKQPQKQDSRWRDPLEPLKEPGYGR